MSERLQFIANHDPIWAVKISEFFDRHPEFAEYVEIAPLTVRPVGFGRNRGEQPANPNMPKTINEFLQYHVCEAGVRREYGYELWLKTRGKSPEEVLANPTITQRKKDYLVPLMRLPPITSVEEIDKINIKGVGIGAKKFARSMFSEYDDYIDATDLAFKIGIAIVYNLPRRASPKQIRELTKSWTLNAVVGTAMCNQIFHYVYEVDKSRYKGL